jgi:hypothetical protein
MQTAYIFTFMLAIILFCLPTAKAAEVPPIQEFQNFSIVRIDYKSHTVVVTDEGGDGSVEWSMNVGPRNWKKFKPHFRYGQHIRVTTIGDFDRITQDHFTPFHIILKSTEQWEKSYS